MKTVSSYGAELRKQNIPIRQTLDIYRSAVSCLTEIYAQIWDELVAITEPNLSYRRIRRYLALSLKATEEHVTLIM